MHALALAKGNESVEYNVIKMAPQEASPNCLQHIMHVGELTGGRFMGSCFVECINILADELY